MCILRLQDCRLIWHTAANHWLLWWLKDLWRDGTCKNAWPSSVRKAIGLDTEISLFSVFRPPRSRKTLAASKHWRFYIYAGYMYHRQSKKQFDNSISLTPYVLITMQGVPNFLNVPCHLSYVSLPHRQLLAVFLEVISTNSEKMLTP